MSNSLIDDQSSRLKQFSWEELDEQFCLAVLLRSGRRYVVQRHFEQQLSAISSRHIQTKWRRCLLEVISKSLSPLYLTRTEVELMHEIFAWHLNSPPSSSIKLREQIDYLIDLEDLIECSRSISLDSKQDNQSFLIQPVTTLDAARKNIELWKNLQGNFLEKPKPIRIDPLTSGWLQFDSKIVPFIQKDCDRLLPMDYLLKEHVISSSEDFSLRSLSIPIRSEDIPIFQNLIEQFSSSKFIINHRTLLITLDHLIFRLKRLFFIRFLSSPTQFDRVDYQKIMAYHGGLVTLSNRTKQRLPFIYINSQKYIPQLNPIDFSSISTFAIANKYELEYLRLVSLYDYLSSDENNDNLMNLLTRPSLTLIPIDTYYDEKQFTAISLHDFHSHEYQRRRQQQQNLIPYDDDCQTSTGWWQPPVSSNQKRPLSHLKLQRPILF